MANQKNYFKKRFNVSQWLGIKSVQQNAIKIKDLAKSDFSNQSADKKAKKKMSFEELIQTNQWTESDIKKNISHQIRMCYGFLMFAAVLLVLAIYLFITSNFFGGGFTLLFMCLSLAYAYQAWVSSEQLKQRKIRINIKQSFMALFHK